VPRETDVLVVGDANPDLVLPGDVRPRFGQAEQLRTAADLVLAGSAGIVAAGLGLRTRLAERGVDARLVTHDPTSRPGSIPPPPPGWIPTG
jgi:hypothetical protein